MSTRMNILASMVAGLALAGCTPLWPPHGHGGMAEHAGYETWPALFAASPSRQVLFDRLTSAEAALDQLDQQGAGDYLPAKLSTARLLATRTRREIAGGLVLDAQQNLLALEVRLNTMRGLLIAFNSTTIARQGE